MSTTVTFNAIQYIIPGYNDTGYAQGNGNLSLYLVALSTGTLQQSGGLFQLTADADFGPNFGIKALYVKSETANIASAGVLRLANSDSIGFRNAANNANLLLAVNGSNQLTFNGTVLEISTLTSAHIFVGNGSNVATDVAMSGDVAITNTGATTVNSVQAGIITNTMVNASAAIAYSKLSLTGSVLNADLAGSIAYSKLVLTGAVVNADISSSAAIVRSKLAATETADLTFASGKGIFFTDGTTNTVKITAPTTVTTYTLKWPTAQGSANQYLTNDGSGNLSWTNAAGTGTVNSGTANQLAYYATSTNAVSSLSTVTTTEIGYVSGVTSAIQTQLNTKAPTAAPTFTGVFTAPGFLIDSSSRVLIGPSTTRTVNGTDATLQVEGTAAAGARPSIVLNINSAAGPELLFGKSRGGSLGSNTIVQTGDFLGLIGWQAANGVDLSSTAANIIIQASGTQSSTSTPATMTFGTTPVGSTSPLTALTLNTDQSVNVAAKNGLQVAGNQTYPIVQVVQGTSTTEFDTTNTAYQTTNLSASITPKFNTSKILIQISSNLAVASGTNSDSSTISIFRGTTNLELSAGSGFVTAIQVNGQTIFPVSVTYYDSPATTSATTYAVKLKTSNARSQASFGWSNTAQIITLMEIAQ